MNSLWKIAEAFSVRDPGGVSIEEKLRGLRNVPPAGITAPWVWAALAGVVLVLVTGVLLAYLARRQDRVRRAWEQFTVLAGEAGLIEEESYLLAQIARLAGLRAAPDTIFTDAKAFDLGLSRLGAPGRRHTFAPGELSSVCSTCIHLVSLREKLGFEPSAAADKLGHIKLGQMRPGAPLTVFRQRAPENLQVYVTDHRSDGKELVVLPEIPLEAHVGETWVVRYPQGGMLWEFRAWVVGNMAGEIVIRPGGQVQWINRRRFSRVAVRYGAQVAHFPLHKAEWDAPTPEFVPAWLLEVGGPGMRVEVPVQADVGDRMLVIARLPRRALETVGVVRHVTPAGSGRWQIALELIGLDTADVADLTQVTNDLASLNHAEALDAQAAEGPGSQDRSLQSAGPAAQEGSHG